jgi:hypothetical protein
MRRTSSSDPFRTLGIVFLAVLAASAAFGLFMVGRSMPEIRRYLRTERM